jgi:hypothetical protein
VAKPKDEKKTARRALKRAIAAAKRDTKVKDLPKKQKKRAAANLGRKNFRTAEAAKPKPQPKPAAGGEAAPAAPA